MIRGNRGARLDLSLILVVINQIVSFKYREFRVFNFFFSKLE
jgi:hypothetical protein